MENSGNGRDWGSFSPLLSCLMFTTSPNHHALTPKAERGPPRLPELLGRKFRTAQAAQRLTEALSRYACSRAGSSGKHLQRPATKRAQERGEGAAGPQVPEPRRVTGRSPPSPPPPGRLPPGQAGPRGTGREFPAEQRGLVFWSVGTLL